MIVALTWREFYQAACAACRIECLDRSRGLRDNQGYAGRSSWNDRILGVTAERAVAKALGIPWDPKFENFRSEPDVGGYEVRATERKHGRLIITPKDALDREYLLVIAHVGREPRFELVGCIAGADGRRVGSWEEHRTDGGAWYVEREQLTPMWLRLPAESLRVW